VQWLWAQVVVRAVVVRAGAAGTVVVRAMVVRAVAAGTAVVRAVVVRAVACCGRNRAKYRPNLD